MGPGLPRSITPRNTLLVIAPSHYVVIISLYLFYSSFLFYLFHAEFLSLCLSLDIFLTYCFFKWAIPGLFFIYFRLFKQTLQFMQQIYLKKMLCPSSIQRRDSNSWPSEHESPTITNQGSRLIWGLIWGANWFCSSGQYYKTFWSKFRFLP